MWPKKKAKAAVISAQHRYEIRHQANRLITVANRAEAAAKVSSQVESTNAGEVMLARELVSAQSALRAAIETALSDGSTVEQLYREVIEPIIDQCVLSELAWMTIDTVVGSAKERRPDQAGYFVNQTSVA